MGHFIGRWEDLDGCALGGEAAGVGAGEGAAAGIGDGVEAVCTAG